MSDKQPEFYTTEDIKRIIGCGQNAVYNLMRDKSFPSVLIGRKYYVNKKEFEKWYKNKGLKEPQNNEK